MIEANRIGLKHIANLTVDAGFAQKLGQTVYLYEGETTEAYKTLGRKFYAAVQSLLETLLQIEKALASEGYDTQQTQEV